MVYPWGATMGEYCYACSVEIFGRDAGDFKGLTPEKAFDEGRACLVLCEGCGNIQVDPYGKCLSDGCLKSGLPGHSCSWERAVNRRRGILLRFGLFFFEQVSRLLK